MSKIVTMMLDGVETKIEVSDEANSAWSNNGPIDEPVSNDLTDQLDKLMKNARYIIDQLKSLSPDETELSFGVKVGGEGKLLCFAEVSTEAQFNVKMTWK